MLLIPAILIFTIQLEQFVSGQIPRPCATLENLQEFECCPVPDESKFPNAGPCGENMNRGSCEEIKVKEGVIFENGDDVDPRKNWPIQLFNKTCVCAENYDGYDCGECKFGYTGDKCKIKKTTAERKSFEAINWDEYRRALKAAKTTESRYCVISKYAESRETIYDNIVNVTVYDSFVWMHHFSANRIREHDYAHEGTGFPTWHRLFLLFLVREIQHIEGYEDFDLSYWNWTDTSLLDELFTMERLGKNMDGIVIGNLFAENEWNLICTDKEIDICDASNYDRDSENNIKKLRRCPIDNMQNVCARDNDGWPTYNDVVRAVTLETYDNVPFDKHAQGVFRNSMEGFQPLQGDSAITDCRADHHCICGYNIINGKEVGDSECECEGTESCKGNRAPIRRKLHNIIHNILGIGDFSSGVESNHEGIMADVAASPNDPVFFFHHTTIDCILETWLKNSKNPKYPTSDEVRLGHRVSDYIVPFIPLYTHEDMFKTADTFGYDCTLFDDVFSEPATTQPSSSSISLQASFSLFLCLLFAVYSAG